jgi:hypothetical protein
VRSIAREYCGICLVTARLNQSLEMATGNACTCPSCMRIGVKRFAWRGIRSPAPSKYSDAFFRSRWNNNAILAHAERRARATARFRPLSAAAAVS